MSRACGSGEVVIAGSDTASLVQSWLLHFILVQVLEQVAFLALVIAYIECVASDVLMLSIEVLDHGQSVVIGTGSHRVFVLIVVAATAAGGIHTVTKAVLMADLSRGVGRASLDHTISVGLHNFLPRA